MQLALRFPFLVDVIRYVDFPYSSGMRHYFLPLIHAARFAVSILSATWFAADLSRLLAGNEETEIISLTHAPFPSQAAYLLIVMEVVQPSNYHFLKVIW
jgi:hypothetical protein